MKMIMFDFRDSEKDFFKKNKIQDLDIEFITEPLNKNSILSEEQLKQTDVINVFTTSHLCEDTLSKFPNLRLIITRSTSFSHIDLSYCTQHGIAVYNVENYGQTAVAEYAIALILMLVRKVTVASDDMKQHKISYKKYEGANLNSLTIGIIGCGAIGSAVAKIAHFFGMKVLVSTYMKNPELINTCEFVDLDVLLKESDIISLHIPFVGDNYHMISHSQFESMKQGVYIVNTSRGELLDIEALYENLKNGKVSGAALDVLECEYLSTRTDELIAQGYEGNQGCVKTALITQKLFNMQNVLITPHIAYNTTQSVNFLLEASFNNVRDYVKGMYTNRVC